MSTQPSVLVIHGWQSGHRAPESVQELEEWLFKRIALIRQLVHSGDLMPWCNEGWIIDDMIICGVPNSEDLLDEIYYGSSPEGEEHRVSAACRLMPLYARAVLLGAIRWLDSRGISGYPLLPDWLQPSDERFTAANLEPVLVNLLSFVRSIDGTTQAPVRIDLLLDPDAMYSHSALVKRYSLEHAIAERLRKKLMRWRKKPETRRDWDLTDKTEIHRGGAIQHIIDSLFQK